MEDRLMDANTEDYLEILYWEFDTEKKKGSFTERDLFKAKMRGLIRTIQNTRATDPLLEKMAEALVDISLYESCHGDDWPARIAKQALQEYRERYDAK